MIGLSEDFSSPQTNAIGDRFEWLRVALANLFDTGFLQRHIRHGHLEAHFADGTQAQEHLLDAIKKLKPGDDVPIRSVAWRTYNVLHLHYVKGLSQSETAVQLNVGVRQLRREQAKAIHALVPLVFGVEPTVTPGNPPSTSPTVPAANQFANHPGLNAQALVRPEDLVQAVLALLDSIIQKRDLHVQVSIHPPLPVLNCNAMIARQLLVSAIDWMLSQMRAATLLIDLSAEGEALTIAMRGPAEHVNLEARPAPAGLTTVRDLAEMADGSAQASHEPSFVTLNLTLPVSKRRYVLVVDDNDDAIQLATRLLQNSPEFEVVAASEAEDALRKVVTLHPACVLLDVMMPQRDGWEILTLLKAHPETASIPVVISSVLQQEALARALGANAFLPKPYGEAQLLAVLRSITLPGLPVTTA